MVGPAHAKTATPISSPMTILGRMGHPLLCSGHGVEAFPTAVPAAALPPRDVPQLSAYIPGNLVRIARAFVPSSIVILLPSSLICPLLGHGFPLLSMI
jgi:hypothetical protein